MRNLTKSRSPLMVTQFKGVSPLLSLRSISSGSGVFPAMLDSIKICANFLCPCIQQMRRQVCPCSSWILISTPEFIRNFATISWLLRHAKCNGVARLEFNKSGFAPVCSIITISDSTWPSAAAVCNIVWLPSLSKRAEVGHSLPPRSFSSLLVSFTCMASHISLYLLKKSEHFWNLFLNCKGKVWNFCYKSLLFFRLDPSGFAKLIQILNWFLKLIRIPLFVHEISTFLLIFLEILGIYTPWNNKRASNLHRKIFIESISWPEEFLLGKTAILWSKKEAQECL